MATITALAPWFGGKRNLAPEIVAEIGKHRVYWETFCGSMAVLLVKPSCIMETVNDLHADLTNLARVIQHQRLGPILYRRLRRTLMAEDLFSESANIIRTEYPVGNGASIERAYHYFITSWLGRNGVAGTASYNAGFCVRYTANGGHAAKRWDSTVRSIPAWRQRLRNVTILCRDAFELHPRIDDKAGTVLYVDPPYVKKGAQYVHDFTDEQHRLLASQLRRFQHSRVIVSYYDHPLLDELYDGWTKRVFIVTKAMANQGQRQKEPTKAREVLLINGPSYMESTRQTTLFE